MHSVSTPPSSPKVSTQSTPSSTVPIASADSSSSLLTSSDAPAALHCLSNHTSLLIITILTTSPSLDSISSSLSHLESLSYLIFLSKTIPTLTIPVPHPLSIYLLAFQRLSLSTLSRLCSVLARFKLSFEAILARTSSSVSTPEQGFSITHFQRIFNGHLQPAMALPSIQRHRPERLGMSPSRTSPQSLIKLHHLALRRLFPLLAFLPEPKPHSLRSQRCRV